MKDKFGEWWAINQFKKKEERFNNFESLSRVERTSLKRALFENGWCELICQNIIDEILDYIKETHDIDLIDLRIQALKFGRVFLIDKIIWEDIENMILEYDTLFNSDTIFGGVVIKPWGRKKNFVRISALRKGPLNAQE